MTLWDPRAKERDVWNQCLKQLHYVSLSHLLTGSQDWRDVAGASEAAVLCGLKRWFFSRGGDSSPNAHSLTLLSSGRYSLFLLPSHKAIPPPSDVALSPLLSPPLPSPLFPFPHAVCQSESRRRRKVAEMMWKMMTSSWIPRNSSNKRVEADLFPLFLLSV